MELTNQQSLPVAQTLAWDALNDITLLQQAIPGCEGISTLGDNLYEVVVVAAIGPVKAKFKGKLQLSDINPPQSYKLQFEGQGGAAGHGKGHAEVRLEAVSDSETLLHYTAHASVGGKIAQIGSRLVDMAAQKMAREFFDKFTAVLVERHAPPPAEAEEPAADGEEPKKAGWLKKIIGKS